MRLKTLFFTSLLLLSLVAPLNAEIIFTDDFEDDPSDWNCGDGRLSKWSAYLQCGYDATLSTGEGHLLQMGTGRGGTGNALYAYRYGTHTEHESACAVVFTGSDLKDELYIRWYQRVPTSANWDKACSAGYKQMRIFFTNSSGGGVWSLFPDHAGTGSTNRYSTSGLHVYCSCLAAEPQASSGYLPNSNGFYNVSNIQDNNWHCYEVHIKLNTAPGVHDGIYEMWVDGVSVVAYKPTTGSGLDLGNGSGSAQTLDIGMIYFGIGNVTVGASWDQASWQATAYDDLVVSTEYVGTGAPTVTYPAIDGLSPAPGTTLTSGTTSTTISCTVTDADVVSGVKFGTSDVAYASMPNSMSNTSGNTWSATVSSLTDGNAYTYYVRAIDALGNANQSSSVITFDVASPDPPVDPDITLLMEEHFEDNDFSDRSWYDGWAGTGDDSADIDSGGQSGNCLNLTWNATTNPIYPIGMPTASARKKFTASESVYISYYLKYDTAWIGSQDDEDGGPHLTHLMTDAQPTDYGSTACSYLTTYSETYTRVDSPYVIYPVFAMQDCVRINSSDCTPPCDLTATTESRSIAGCNGFMENQDTGTFYTCYGSYNNGLFWRQSSTTIPKNQWVRMELYLKMNSIVGGEAVADGKMYNWVDGVLSASSDTVVFRTGAYPTQKFDRFLIAPYMGPGSDATQTMWIDELTVYNGINLDVYDTAITGCYLTNSSAQGQPQTNPNASLGGYRSTTPLSTISMKNLFDDVSVAEALVGDTEYRMIDIYNLGTKDAKKVQIFMKTPTSSPGTEIAFGASMTDQPHADSWNGEALANESTAPASPAFTFANRTRGSPLSLGTIPAGQSVRVGVRRTVSPLTLWTSGDVGVIGIRYLSD